MYKTITSAHNTSVIAKKPGTLEPYHYITDVHLWVQNEQGHVHGLVWDDDIKAFIIPDAVSYMKSGEAATKKWKHLSMSEKVSNSPIKA